MPVNSFENYPMSWKPKPLMSDKPLYLDLAEQLEHDIRCGRLLPGTKLPPQRELADFLDINVSTISRAFKICTQKGLLSGTVGSGTFVSYDALANQILLPAQDNSPLLEFGSVIPEHASYQELASILKKMITEPDFGNLFQYGSTEGRLWHRKAGVKIIHQMGYPATEDKLLFSGGGQNAIAAILSGLFHAGDRIGTDPLTYPGIKSTAKMLGIELVPIAHAQGEISEEGILYACKNERIKGIYIMPEFQNPTVHMMSDAGKQMIARVAKSQDLIVIEDGIYNLFNSTPRPAVASYAPEHTIFIASISKSIAPGLRLSYLVSPERYHSALTDALYNLNLITSPFLLELASRAIVSGQAEQLLETHRNFAKRRNRRMNQILAGYDLRGAEESISRWLILPEDWSGTAFEASALEAGVQVYAAERFAVGKARPVPAVRLAVSSAKAEEDFEEGLQRIYFLLKQK